MLGKLTIASKNRNKILNVKLKCLAYEENDVS